MFEDKIQTKSSVFVVLRTHILLFSLQGNSHLPVTIALEASYLVLESSLLILHIRLCWQAHTCGWAWWAKDSPENTHVLAMHSNAGRLPSQGIPSAFLRLHLLLLPTHCPCVVGESLQVSQCLSFRTHELPILLCLWLLHIAMYFTWHL